MKKITVLDLHGYSPDINPKENPFSVYQRNLQNLSDLKVICQQKKI